MSSRVVQDINKRFAAYWGEPDVVSAARKAVRTELEPLHLSDAPISIEAIAKHFDIEQITEEELNGYDGLLLRTVSNKYVVRLRKGMPSTRGRFTIAHEIGHMIVNRSLRDNSPFDKELKLDCQSVDNENIEEEKLCDLLAAELLMPYDKFSHVVEDTGLSARTIPRIAGTFDVSLQAACRRVTQLVPYEIGISLWKQDREHQYIVSNWLFRRNRRERVVDAILVGKPGSHCFRSEPQRGWYWFPLYEQMDRYFIDICPLNKKHDTWIAIFVFSKSAEHIFAKISNARAAKLL